MDKLPRIEWDLERLEANATRTTANVTGMPRGGGGNRQEEANIALADATEAYREALEELEALRAQLRPIVDALTDINEKAIMRMRYLDGYYPKEIAAIIKRTNRSVYYSLERAERKVLSKRRE